MLLRRLIIAGLLTAGACLCSGNSAQAQEAYGKQSAHTYNTTDWNRFYHYPYVWYPQNFYGDEYYRSSESLYFRYPQEMRIPVYHTGWHNNYPEGNEWNRYHHGYKGPPTGGATTAAPTLSWTCFSRFEVQPLYDVRHSLEQEKINNPRCALSQRGLLRFETGHRPMLSFYGFCFAVSYFSRFLGATFLGEAILLPLFRCGMIWPAVFCRHVSGDSGICATNASRPSLSSL